MSIIVFHYCIPFGKESDQTVRKLIDFFKNKCCRHLILFPKGRYGLIQAVTSKVNKVIRTTYQRAPLRFCDSCDSLNVTNKVISGSDIYFYSLAYLITMWGNDYNASKEIAHIRVRQLNFRLSILS